MKQISLAIPETLDLSESELKLFIAAKLYEQGKLSLGEAAQLANISKKTFIEMIGLFSVRFLISPFPSWNPTMKMLSTIFLPDTSCLIILNKTGRQ